MNALATFTTAIFDFLNTYDGAISALATVTIAVATLFYVVYTRRLWQQTRAQIEILRESVELTALDVRSRIRPYLSATLEQDSRHLRAIRCRFVVRNVGPVPALITSIAHRFLIGDTEDASTSESPTALFPEQTMKTPWMEGSGSVLLRIRLDLKYSSTTGGAAYTTEVGYKCAPEDDGYSTEHAKAT